MEQLTEQGRFILLCVNTGIVVMFGFDLLNLGERLLRMKGVLQFLVDYVYWIVCSFLFFVLLYQVNDGKLRVFFLVGISIGGAAYYLGPRKFVCSLWEKHKQRGKRSTCEGSKNV